MGTRSGFTDARDLQGAEPPRKSLIRDLAETVLVCVVFVLFLRAYVFQQSEIPSASMENTILVGDHVLVNRFIYAPTTFDWERRILPIRDLQRGDVVVFKHPPEPEQDFIKRVIGLPGETLALRNGTLFVDGVPVDEPYLDERARVGQSFGPVRVEPGSYFLMGDNRPRSADSRVWGTAERRMIKGRAFLILFSTDTERDPGRPVGQVTAKSLFRKLFDVVFHSRWERCLSLIR